jgi:prepilin-type N-terminal cleavage/methylation domain-containing protein
MNKRGFTLIELLVVIAIIGLFYDDYNRYPSSADGDYAYDASFLAGGCLEALITEDYLPRLPVEPDSTLQYYYSNWCSDPPGTNNQRFRMRTTGELDNDGLSQNWWNDRNIGITPCADPTAA